MTSSQQARDVIQQIVEKLVSGYAPQRAILFGSYAYGDPTPDSDIDLLIIKDTDKRPSERWMEVDWLLRDRKQFK